jgi:hypothetical protein
MFRLLQIVTGIVLATAAVPAFSQPPPVPVPEPISLSLFAIGAGGTIVVRALRKRRK